MAKNKNNSQVVRTVHEDGCSYHLDKRDRCIDIDIDKGIERVKIKYNTVIDFAHKMKQFPDVKELYIYSRVNTILVSNFMFPNVRNINSESYYFNDKATTLQNQFGTLYNSFCLKPGETLDLRGINNVIKDALRGCMTDVIVYDNDKYDKKAKNFMSGLYKQNRCNMFKDSYFSLVQSERGYTICGDVIAHIEENDVVDIREDSNTIRCIGTDYQSKDGVIILHDLAVAKTITMGLKCNVMLDTVQYKTPYIISRIINNINGCTGVEISQDNPFYTTIDGILYTKDKKTLIACPNGKTGIVRIPDGTEEIFDSAFYGSSISEVYFPSSLSLIGNEAFSCSQYLSNIHFSSGITEIPRCCFDYCSKIKSIEIPANVRTIRQSAFSGVSIESVTFNEGLTEIEDGAFTNVNLETLTLPSSLRHVGVNNFMRCKEIMIPKQSFDKIIRDIHHIIRISFSDDNYLTIKITIIGTDKSINVPRHFVNYTESQFENAFGEFLMNPEFDKDMVEYSLCVSLHANANDKAIMQDTALELYKTGNKYVYDDIKKRSKSIMNRYLKEGAYDKLINLIKMDIFTAGTLEKLLKIAQDKQQISLSAYILQKLNEKKPQKTSKKSGKLSL